MKFIVCLVLVSSIGFSSGLHSISNDQEAYNYCVSDPSSYIAIIWPLAQGKDKTIEKIFNTYGSFKYKKIVYLTYDQTFALLKYAHPHISDMQSHMELYFPRKGTSSRPARVYVTNFASLALAVKCKREIRHIFSIGYPSIHINDYHHETLHLAHLFFIGAYRKIRLEKETDYHCSPTSNLSAYYACLRMSLS